MNKQLVRVFSKKIIKPSLPTPTHLSTFMLSLLDIFVPSYYIPVILFFDSDDPARPSESDFHHLLKRSLSDVLTTFYPLAGRIKDKHFVVDCNDIGVDYFEAKVNGSMSEFKSPDLLSQLLPPADIISINMVKEVPLVIQVNVFDLGGIAISVCMSHKISDASSLATFINVWAAKAREAKEVVSPTYDTPSLFPLRALTFPVPDTDVGPGSGDDTGENKLITKRFVIDSTKLAALRARIAESPGARYPTRVEAVSALIWKSLMNPDGASYKSILKQPVNLRRRMEPPLPQESFGNIVSLATSTLKLQNSHSLDELVGHLRIAINKIDGDYVRRFQGDDDGFLQLIAKEGGFMGEAAGQEKVDEEYLISSWCKFPFYESDFGWGKPVWVTCSPLQALEKNWITLMDTKCGEGIEVWLKLEEEDMASFEHSCKDIFEC